MDSLKHEDLLIKLRAKLNEEKIKLWESPYISDSDEISDTLKELANKYATVLNIDNDSVLQGLHELQIHSLERSKANEEFKETGCATFRVKVTMPGQKPKILKILKKLTVQGEELINSIAELLEVGKNRIKLIYNGKLISHSSSLEAQGVKNGAQLMALIMAETPEQVQKEDKIYKEMKSTLDDATLLSEYVDDLADDEEYMKLEDQSGQAVELPPAERRALLIGLALHERGRAAAQNRDYSLALVLLLEADRQLNECRSSLLSTVDNCAVLQLDIAWCYLCLQSLSSANDAATRLMKAQKSFIASYGEDHQRLIALKGTNANERVLFMRLYLLQGIVAYHQNKREEAKALLAKAETELNYLKVDEAAVCALRELGWSDGQARRGLRAAGGAERAHAWLAERAAERLQHRETQSAGTCADGSALLRALQAMGYPRALAARALRRAGNDAAGAVRLIQDTPHLLADSDVSDSEEIDTASSDDSLVVPDNELVAELEAMGYPAEEARTALRLSHNHINKAVDLLIAGCSSICDTSNPSTSDGAAKKKLKKEAKEKRKKEREMALRRLKSAIRADEDDYLSASLVEEEQFLTQYKSLI
ncbi:NEDD8 ultimate buster 1 [Nymphalis io]|uniref:NEDD8 ultimate buster 1 n=1 Tax=Inachis io TaxID=171585 RepID=UPI0021698D89|nr:NEDD8 ultimate buster 1 [Nymphalis io]XP_050355275.1 NEDD8 ultimate buster 1 [Nymphalis io]